MTTYDFSQDPTPRTVDRVDIVNQSLSTQNQDDSPLLRQGDWLTCPQCWRPNKVETKGQELKCKCGLVLGTCK